MATLLKRGPSRPDTGKLKAVKKINWKTACLNRLISCLSWALLYSLHMLFHHNERSLPTFQVGSLSFRFSGLDNLRKPLACPQAVGSSHCLCFLSHETASWRWRVLRSLQLITQDEGQMNDTNISWSNFTFNVIIEQNQGHFETKTTNMVKTSTSWLLLWGQMWTRVSAVSPTSQPPSKDT